MPSFRQGIDEESVRSSCLNRRASVNVRGRRTIGHFVKIGNDRRVAQLGEFERFDLYVIGHSGVLMNQSGIPRFHEGNAENEIISQSRIRAGLSMEFGPRAFQRC